MKSTLLTFTLLLGLLSFTLVKDQVSNQDHVETILKQLREYPGQTLGYGAAKIYHVYDVTIPEEAEIKETTNAYMINPVYITMAVSNTFYDITKQKVPYRMTIFKEYKGSHAMGRKDVSGIEVIWQKKESTKEFSGQLKALKNLSNTSFDELYGPEDDFPEEWKTK